MCHIGSAAVTSLTSMTGGARAKNSETAEPGTLLHVESASCWRGRSPRRLRRSHQDFIYRVLFSNFNPTSRGFAAATAAAVVVIVSAKTRISGRSLCLCGCIVFSLRTAALPHLSDLHDVHGSPPTSMKSWLAKWEKKKKNTDKQKRYPTYYPF